jgi:hypothetical protein
MTVTRILASLLFGIGGIAAAQQAPDGLQFNVRYLCNDGHTYVVHKCEKGPKFEACFYQREQDSERYNTRAAVVYQMTKMCKALGPAAPSAPAQGSATAPGQAPKSLDNSRWDCGAGATMTLVQCGNMAGQQGCWVRLEQNGKFLTQAPKPLADIQNHVKACKALPADDPAYLAEFPNPYRVVQGMLTGKPQDNMTRAIGAFYQLSEIIHVLAGSRRLTADEQKFIGDYNSAQSALAKLAAQKFPGQQIDVASNPYRFKPNDPRFGFEGIPVWATFLTPGTQDAFARLVGGEDSQYAMAVSREKAAAIKQVDNDAKAANAEASYAKDPGSVALRHCVESGRSETECLGEGLKIGVQDLMGGNPLKGIVPETPVGLRLTGVYSAGSFGLQFGQDSVTVRCGALVPQTFPYAVERSGLQISVRVPISPKPLLLAYKVGGNMSGPGSIDVSGVVPIGGMRDNASTTYEMQTTTTTTQQQLNPGEEREYSADQLHQNGGQFSVDQQTSSTNWTPTIQHHYSVPTAPKTERCNVGTLPPTGANVSMSGALTGLLGSKPSRSANTAPGLRINGTYKAQGGLKIEFRDDSATLECGESFNSEAYAVTSENSQLVVKFQNSTGPLSLVLQPDGSITGPGDVEVTGRRAIQADGGGMEYLPRNDRCSLGTLRP